MPAIERIALAFYPGDVAPGAPGTYVVTHRAQRPCRFNGLAVLRRRLITPALTTVGLRVNADRQLGEPVPDEFFLMEPISESASSLRGRLRPPGGFLLGNDLPVFAGGVGVELDLAVRVGDDIALTVNLQPSTDPWLAFLLGRTVA